MYQIGWSKVGESRLDRWRRLHWWNIGLLQHDLLSSPSQTLGPQNHCAEIRISLRSRKPSSSVWDFQKAGSVFPQWKKASQIFLLICGGSFFSNKQNKCSCPHCPPKRDYRPLVQSKKNWHPSPSFPLILLRVYFKNQRKGKQDHFILILYYITMTKYFFKTCHWITSRINSTNLNKNKYTKNTGLLTFSKPFWLSIYVLVEKIQTNYKGSQLGRTNWK